MPSKALEVNLACSRVDVTIRYEYGILQEVMSRYQGIMEGLSTFLKELSHPYRNWAFIVKEARGFSLDYFHLLRAHPKGTDAAKIYINIFLEAINHARERRVRGDAADNLLLYLKKIIKDSGKALQKFLPVLDDAFNLLSCVEEMEFTFESPLKKDLYFLQTRDMAIRERKRPLSFVSTPEAVTTVMGLNGNDYDPRRHRMSSGASCTTTCLAHMMKPLVDTFGPKRILTASMATVHASTGSQEVLDRLAEPGATDLRKSRSVFNNIILTTTGAADTLGLVIPEMRQIGFIAESVRIPNTTGSLIILVVNLQEELSGALIRRDTVNGIYREASKNDPNGYLHFTDDQNVSGDIIGLPKAAAIIEGHETHTRTAEVTFDLKKVCRIREDVMDKADETIVRIPVTQAVIYGWYDNELGSYVNMLGDLTVSVAENM